MCKNTICALITTLFLLYPDLPLKETTMDSPIYITREPPPENYNQGSVIDLQHSSHQTNIGRNSHRLFTSGFCLLRERFSTSNYGDISAPAPLEERRVNPTKPLIGIFAIQKNTVVVQMYIYNAHMQTPVDDDFQKILKVFRRKDSRGAMIHFGSLASGEHLKTNPRVIGKVLREGFEFAKEIRFDRAFACVHPKHVDFYKSMIGFRQLAAVKCITGLQNAPGVLMDATPSSLNFKNLLRL